jgi:hypothetical protein
MSLELVREIWYGIKPYLSAPDATEAADTLVNLLIDHDYSASEINDEFTSDSCIKKALEPYHVDEEDEYDDSDDFEFDEDY